MMVFTSNADGWNSNFQSCVGEIREGLLNMTEHLVIVIDRPIPGEIHQTTGVVSSIHHPAIHFKLVKQKSTPSTMTDMKA
jgi:hypothetical protein